MNTGMNPARAKATPRAIPSLDLWGEPGEAAIPKEEKWEIWKRPMPKSAHLGVIGNLLSTRFHDLIGRYLYDRVGLPLMSTVVYSSFKQNGSNINCVRVGGTEYREFNGDIYTRRAS